MEEFGDKYSFVFAPFLIFEVKKCLLLFWRVKSP